MGTAMLIAAIYADAAAAAAGVGVHAVSHPPPFVTALPVAGVAAWPVRRCGDGVPGTYEATAGAAIDSACVRLVVQDRSDDRPEPGRRPIGGVGAARHPALGGREGFGGAGWRVARATLPALRGLVGPGGMGLGIGSELALVRGARMTLHLAAARDTHIAPTAFAPETTVLARCACWQESEAIGAGLNGGRRSAASPPAR